MAFLNNSLYISHQYVKALVKPGDIVVDATCGNGHDTLFLSQLVGETGRVFAFDIQKVAIESAKHTLKQSNAANNVTFFHCGHEMMDQYVTGPVKAVMFNFGYLPKGDHCLGTKAETSIIAIQKAMQLIVPGGIVMLVLYYGGDSGFDEKEAICQFIETIPYRQFSVLRHDYVNQPNCPPIAVCIEKLPNIEK